jgi:hypothetical protein
MAFFTAYEFLKKTIASYLCHPCVEEAEDDLNLKLRDGA